jgi:hypothetical protein
MPKPNPLLDHVKSKLRGENPATPPGEPVSRDKSMAAEISAQLRGKQAPRDITGYDQPTAGDTEDTQTSDTQTAEDEARDKLSQLDDGSEILAALDDPSDELHATAKRLLAAYTALVTIERKKGGQ